jgi:hypothetical protein
MLAFYHPSKSCEVPFDHLHKDTSNFRTRTFDGDLQIGINFPDLELYFCEGGQKVPHSFWLDDRTPAFAEAWYLVELLHRDRDQSKFSTDPSDQK